jgi:hypothetical protein
MHQEHELGPKRCIVETKNGLASIPIYTNTMEASTLFTTLS